MSVQVPDSVAKMKSVNQIVVSVTGYKYDPGVRGIKLGLTPEQARDFSIYMAVSLAKEFVRVIDSQRYKSSKWPPLSISYLQWKKRKHLSLKIWEATGYLKSHIRIFKHGSNIVIGFRDNDFYPKHRVPLNLVAKFVEYGTMKMPARPLWRPILLQVRKHIEDYFKRYKSDLQLMGKEYLYIPVPNKSAKLFVSKAEALRQMRLDFQKNRMRRNKKAKRGGIEPTGLN